MSKNQRFSDKIKPLTEITNQVNKEEMNMKYVPRQLFLNWTKNYVLQGSNEKLVLTGGITKFQNSKHLRNFSCEGKQKLLKFPAFPLQETIDRFLKSCEPLLTKSQLIQQTKDACSFVNCEGNELQELLIKEAEKSNNWLAGRWLKAAYMQYRDPVTIFSSPGMAFPLREFCSKEDYIEYTSRVIYCLLAYKNMVDCGQIPIIKAGDLELDNSQFGKVFGTCRIPCPKEDQLEYYPDSQHIVVIHKNRFFQLNCFDDVGRPYHPSSFANKIREIIKETIRNGPEIGLLTNENRDTWAEAYRDLVNDPVNLKSVESIKKSLFTVSLDQCVDAKKENRIHVLAEQLIHGGGPSHNASNRWMDKTIQFVSIPNGMSGFTYEHSPAEGQPIANMTDYVLQNLKSPEFFADATCADIIMKKLKFKTNDVIEGHIKNAKNNIEKLTSDLETYVVHYKKYGKEFLKLQKLSPDSFVQMAIQYAFYRVHKVPGPQYESAHLRIYHGGRTETIRSCSSESLAFAQTMMNCNATDEVKVKYLRDAIIGHRAYTKTALEGRGVDRHLLGLKLMAIENDLPIPEFYKSPGIAASSNYRISTSQVASTNDAFMAYGPITKDGYACCYNPRKNDIFLGLSAWRSHPETSVKKFADALQRAFDDMHSILQKAGIKPKAKL